MSDYDQRRRDTLEVVPPSDCNFRSALGLATYDELAEALHRRAFLGHKTAYAALRAEIHRRHAESGDKARLPDLPTYVANYKTRQAAIAAEHERYAKAAPHQQATMRAHGYVPATPAPSVAPASAAPSLSSPPSSSPMSKGKATTTTDVAVVFDESKLTASQRLAKFQAATIDALEQVAATEKLNIERRLGVGIALRIVKASLPHGQFTPWLKANVKDAGYRQCAYMMRLAEAFVEEVGLSGETLKAIGAGKVSLQVKPKGKPTAIQKAAADFIGELTWGELLAKHDIRDGASGGGGGGGSAKTKPLSAEELYQQSRDEIGGVLDRAETLFLKENRLQYLAAHPEEIAGVVTGLRELADKVEAAAKPLLKSAA